jgi:hypothetical protein
MGERAIHKLRSLSDDCQHLRPSDLDGLPEDELHSFLSSLKDKSKTASIKVAVHGTDHGGWTPVDPNHSPYSTSPLVNSQPNFGGRWRDDFPGAGGQHINDDSDTDKNTKGEANDDDFSPSMRRNRINDAIDSVKGPKYVVRRPLSTADGDEAATKVFGPEGKSDGTAMYVVVNSYEKAIELSKKIPGCTVERKKT